MWFRLWMFVTAIWLGFAGIVAFNSGGLNRLPPSQQQLTSLQCQERLGFWPDGARMGAKELDDYAGGFFGKISQSEVDWINGNRPGPDGRRRTRTPEEIARHDWVQDIRQKIDDCEAPLRIAATIKQQRFEIAAFALAPPIVLYPLGLLFIWLYGFANRLWGTVSPHMRRGLLRLYIAITVLWVAWFGYAAYGTYSNAKRLQAIYTLFLVPLGVPLLLMVVLWIMAGFRKQEIAKSSPVTSAVRSAADYQAILERAISNLPGNIPQARQALYARAKSALVTQLRAQDGCRD
jgi:hypothetical protein